MEPGSRPLTRVYVQLSGESWPLARAEVDGAVEVLGGRVIEGEGSNPSIVAAELPDGRAPELASRLALAHRSLVEAPAWSEAGRDRAIGTAAFRTLGRPSGGSGDPSIHVAATAWKRVGGRIDLDAPARRFWLLDGPTGGARWLEEIGPVDRRATASRSIAALPFRRPVGLAPRLARAAANLARAGPGRRVVDPFLGTGALLAEAALLGARVFGVDRDPEMVRGALRNFAHLGVVAESLTVGDAEVAGPPGPFDAVLSDPPYGRSSSTRGEAPARLLDRVLPRWAERLRPGGFLVVVVPEGVGGEAPGWRPTVSVPVRVHRSLTREFRVYRRPV